MNLFSIYEGTSDDLSFDKNVKGFKANYYQACESFREIRILNKKLVNVGIVSSESLTNSIYSTEGVFASIGKFLLRIVEELIRFVKAIINAIVQFLAAIGQFFVMIFNKITGRKNKVKEVFDDESNYNDGTAANKEDWQKFVYNAKQNDDERAKSDKELKLNAIYREYLAKYKEIIILYDKYTNKLGTGSERKDSYKKLLIENYKLYRFKLNQIDPTYTITHIIDDVPVLVLSCVDVSETTTTVKQQTTSAAEKNKNNGIINSTPVSIIDKKNAVDAVVTHLDDDEKDISNLKKNMEDLKSDLNDTNKQLEVIKKDIQSDGESNEDFNISENKDNTILPQSEVKKAILKHMEFVCGNEAKLFEQIKIRYSQKANIMLNVNEFFNKIFITVQEGDTHDKYQIDNTADNRLTVMNAKIFDTRFDKTTKLYNDIQSEKF